MQRTFPIRVLSLLAAVLGLCGPVHAQSTPSASVLCPGAQYSKSWTNCVGKYTFADGARYQGGFRDGDLHGLGSVTFSDGDRYVGEFRQGKRWGQGTFYFAGGNRYTGEFVDGKMSGLGVYLFASTRGRYAGPLQDSKFQGVGTFTLANGSRYVGEFRDDNYNGRGVFYDANGTVLTAGTWADDKLVSAQSPDTTRFPFQFNAGVPPEFLDAAKAPTWPACRGTQYVKTWTNCIGTYPFDDGSQYVGPFNDGEFHGHGTFIFPSGHRYVGDFQQNKRTGRGLVVFANGDRYLGDHVDGARTGSGTYHFAESKNRYVGQMQKGVIHGVGSFFFADGGRYIGEFRDGKYSGQGVMYRADGTVASMGVWADNRLQRSEPVDVTRWAGLQPAGLPAPAPASASATPTASPPPCPGTQYSRGWTNCIGSYSFPNGARFVGTFRDGNFNGQGTYTFEDGTRYVGEFRNDKRTGRGTFFYLNGDRYSGDFIDGEYSGSGTYHFAASGNRYVGTMLASKFHGVGTFFYADGDRYVGEFRNDKFHGPGIFYKADGTVSSAGTWVDSKLARAEALDPQRFPFVRSAGNAVAAAPAAAAAALTPAPSTAALTAETERLRAEAEQARERQRQAEEALARMQQQAQTASARPAVPVRPLDAHALVIGNAAYAGSSRLTNPVNDAKAMSEKLRALGFKVTEVTDANRARLVAALSQFNRSAAQADLSLLFYSGHGVQILGTNYMLPVDIDQSDVAQATIQGVSLNSVVEQFMPGKTKLVFLDACRDNPLARSDSRSVSKGLAPINAAQGTLISYATKDGQVAADGVGQRNSPFTRALLEHLSDPDDIAVVLRKVREKVMAATGGKQQPWEYGSLTGGALVLSAVRPPR
jgi:hypothetical protein